MPLLTVAMTTAARHQHSFGEQPAPKVHAQRTKQETRPSVSLGLRSIQQSLLQKVFVSNLCCLNGERHNCDGYRITRPDDADARCHLYGGVVADTGWLFSCKEWQCNNKTIDSLFVLLQCKNICALQLFEKLTV